MSFRMKKKEREKRINNIHTKDCMGEGNENKRAQNKSVNINSREEK